MINKQFKISLLLFCVVLSVNTQAQKDTLSFVHITDLHLMFNTQNYDQDIVQARKNKKNYKESNNTFKQFMATIPEQTSCDMIIVTGDLVDFFDAKTGQGNRFAYHVEQFANFIKEFHYPIYLTLGNHDMFSYNWNGEKVVANQLQAGRAKATWIRNFDCFRDGTYYSHVYEVGRTTYRLIFLDNGFYKFKKEEGMVNPYIDKAQLHWLQAELDASDDDVEIILMHIPFTEKSTLPESNNELYKALIATPSVRLILGGHYHKQDVMWLPSPDTKQTVQVQTGALVSGADKWRQVRLTEEDITVSSMGTTESELIIPVK
ncbi:metallophosphoesterase family protein [Proteiniphilum sp. UBA5384]|uniref:metallophosphoesterase family protein n=1 Tax=Proteiniphilum sp. UBA5384 TaxID=1947279 RepID=UPI0025D4B9F3|nr:metallophosphoesterase [Proteiniphilum sp. UBA5384]